MRVAVVVAQAQGRGVGIPAHHRQIVRVEVVWWMGQAGALATDAGGFVRELDFHVVAPRDGAQRRGCCALEDVYRIVFCRAHEARRARPRASLSSCPKQRW